MERKEPSSEWYKNIWSLDIKNQSWVENTVNQVDFIEEVLGLFGNERILDLACGYGRHALELARRGYSVVGVDITQAYVEDAITQANKHQLDVQFYETDIRNLLDDDRFIGQFDVVLNLADGAIGYLENDDENHKIFQVISKCLVRGGKSLMDVCNKEHAVMHFPKKYWEIGESSIALPWFDYDEENSRMLYGGFNINLGEKVILPDVLEAHSSIRLYDCGEIEDIFSKLNMKVCKSFGDYDIAKTSSHKSLQLLVVSEKS